MKTVSNIDLIISVRDLLKEGLQAKELSYPVCDAVFPTANRPDEFFVVRTVSNKDRGNVEMQGVVEVAVYVKNLNKGNDQTQPNLSRLKVLTDAALDILNDGITNATAITSTDPRLVSHPEIQSFYNSIVCETFSVKSY